MLHLHPFRDAATVHVDAPPDRVAELLSQPSILQALDRRIPLDRPLDVVREDDRVEVCDLDGHVHLRFRIQADGDGTRLSALESVRPSTPIEATKHLLFPAQRHEELRGGLVRLAHLLEEL